MGDGARRTVSWPAKWPLPFLLAEVPLSMGPPGKELCFPALLASVHGEGGGGARLQHPLQSPPLTPLADSTPLECGSWGECGFDLADGDMVLEMGRPETWMPT